MSDLREFQDSLIVSRIVSAAKRSESMQVGKWYIQNFSDKDLYFYATGEQKNGGLSGVTVTHDLTSRGAPKAKKDSVPKGFMRLWKSAQDVPEKVQQAAKTKMASTDALVERVVEAAKKKRSEEPDGDWSKDQKKGEWNLIISKSRATRWDYFLKNPKGGGGGSTSYKSVKEAIAAAIGRGVADKMGKDKVWVIIQEWDSEKEDYKTKKSYWMDFPK